MKDIIDLAYDIHTKDPVKIKKKWGVCGVEAEKLLCEKIEAFRSRPNGEFAAKVRQNIEITGGAMHFAKGCITWKFVRDDLVKLCDLLSAASDEIEGLKQQLRDGLKCQSFDMCGSAHEDYKAKLQVKDEEIAKLKAETADLKKALK